MTNRRATISDVAREANVSPSTASVVFSGKTPVSDATRERVLAAAATLGYAGPDPLAASLRRGRSGIVGVVVGSNLNSIFTDPVQRLLMDGLAEAVAPLGAGLLLLRSTSDIENAPTLTTAPVDAAVLIGCDAELRDSLDDVRARGIPIVVIEGDAGPGVPRVRLDNREAQRLAAEHLRELGHTDVAIVTLRTDAAGTLGRIEPGRVITIDVTRERLEGARDVYPGALALATSGSTIDDGLAAARTLFADPERRPTAVIAQSDLLATGVIRAAEEAGLRVPEDVSVTGFDGVPVDGLAPFRLTTLVQAATEKGRAAGAAIAAMLEGEEPASVLLTCEFRLGNTSGPAPAPPLDWESDPRDRQEASLLVLLAAFAVVPLTLPWLTGRIGPRAFFVAALVPLAGFVHAGLLTPLVLAGETVTETFSWIPQLGLSLSMRMDTLSWAMTLIVTGVGALVMIYCRWYFDGKTSGVGMFSATLLAFAGAMYGLVLTDDLILLVMFWEITSILSYLLIGYYHARGASRRAALQALLVTTLGGLVMFVGAVILVVQAGTNSISGILAEYADTASGFAASPLIDTAIVLLLVGALSKSAIFPFHFWLPGAMAAPTPVSAYLHAAAMVKAGIYLIARVAPFFAVAAPWRPIVVALGIFTMLLGGLQALRESDLKRILAFGTVSQLGLLTAVIGYGERNTALAGLALLIGHALFKSALFLVVGVIDRQLSTRDIGELSGVGRQAPTLAVASALAVASMIGIIPMVGFIAKEAALTSLLEAADEPWALVALIGIVLGSVLTTAYGLRFFWGAFATKKDASGVRKPATAWPDPPMGFLAAPIVLAALSLIAGFAAPWLDTALRGYADTAPEVGDPYHLALWHGLEPALFLSLGCIAVGAALFGFAVRTGKTPRRLLTFTAADVYNLTLRGIARLAVWTTSLTQRGSLPVYVGTIFVVFVASQATALLASPDWKVELDAWQTPIQVVVAPIMILAGIVAVRARKRYTGVVLVSVTGLGMVVLFATSGAPDLALTQVLVETVTLVTFTLVLRRIPARLGEHNASVWPVARAVLAVAVGATMAIVAMVATGARIEDPISDAFPDLAYELGHGKNVVNVALVDLRGWDTMGELSVLILAATGVASLVFVTHRSDLLSRAISSLPTSAVRTRRPLVETEEGPRPRASAPGSTRQAWLVGGQRMRPENRSIMLEVIVRILFHTIIVVSIYLLFAGHNLPGGGFAGGLVAGMALVMRYVAGGRYELGAAAPTDAGRLLGAGMTLAIACAIVPLLFGEAPLTSHFWEAELPVLGHVEFVTSTLFDIGVYLVVIGLVLDVLRSLGGEVDRQVHELREAQSTRTTGGIS